MWDAWKAYAHRAGQYQSLVVLNVAYVVVLGPSAVLARLFGTRLLDLDGRPRQSYWVKRERRQLTLADLRRQF